MNISWNGFGSFTIAGKPIDGEVTLVTDPYQNTTGLRFPRTLKASIVAQSHAGDYANNITSISAEGDKRVFLVSHAGEYEVGGIAVQGITALKKDGTEHTIFKIMIEDVKIAFLGALDRELTEKEVEALGNIDVLIIPIGGKSVMNASTATEVVSQIEPRIVIPSFAHIADIKEAFADIGPFCKEIGCVAEEVNKAKITKSSLPDEEMQVLILSRS
ncbi:MAG: Zn-dependent hydrolase of the beta-lactamase fold-like protein [uncultured bacterium]|uniref:Zn-dependent hydrolase of the beta-lactamase fold-like protein n=1 Tax=Candidatus Uhrbacteria bacterium GW2011_GWC1_41_20 TaxID=1618983 RepID=A0A0G0XSL7_9BACT|nr:MAG: Zn-dependent hydrolase of the beta-lactamase fold-like protein [uncultured bacterium]KKR23215.1 MAG: Zn-dependent hydrolase of the beta-lactamase fold-like protein [Candidatus Uhrbacteria bacterium GW2011_GWE1_39_46]KKR64397.1 MAG: Zn-dependent hydrolase of the beta-lactamase fold-like protein [Candidatus Uhrbacteria bacterium GW2011_GWC2_40_450]KKR89841.1 MAG: Zn-dependent hydrolase of the beta-lactamase fold-like protein [Candidatus Uhrbacteria bacterium GW2011_GWE2_41_1153]KKR90724.1